MSNSPSNSDNNMVNLYGLRLRELNIDGKITNTREQLAQWRQDCYKTIDEFYQQKLDELNSHTNEFKTSFEEKRLTIQTQISQLGQEQENTDQRTTIIHSLEQNLNDLEQTAIDVHLRTLTIPKNSISINKEFNLTKLPVDSSKISYTSTSSSAIASNEEYLLMQQDPYLLLLDQDFKMIKQEFWSYGWIRDICWSKTLDCFILITDNHIYLINNNLQIDPSFKQDIPQNWFSCSCSKEYLFLSTCQWGSSIYQFNLMSSLDLIQQWKSPSTCEAYEGINDIQCDNETIALLINNDREHRKRLELKSFRTFSTIWSLELSVGLNIRLFTCCSINSNEWLVVDGTNSHIYQISKDGKFKNDITYHAVPYRANVFASSILAIAAENDLNLYQIAV